ncbi:hypothetical protein PQX77_010886 [Marasmius sp. AFHP31]|nr:hypothetical protein PQX77_010886 [Marasmius sp. AFHP31]
MSSSGSISPAALQAIFNSLESGWVVPASDSLPAFAKSSISLGESPYRRDMQRQVGNFSDVLGSFNQAYSLPIALVLYDFFLTFSAELNQMWFLKKKNLVFGLFTVLRYSTIFYQVTFSMAFFLPIRSIKIDFFVSAKVVTQSPQFRQFGSCSQNFSGNFAVWNTASAALALAFDTIVVTLTVLKTARSWVQTQEAGIKNSYSYYFLRDGLLYYFGVEFLLLFTVIFNQVPALSIRVARVMIILQTSVAPILAQRLVLNLLSVDKILNVSRQDQSSLPTMDFAHGSFIGNIGAPLDIGREDESPEGTEGDHELPKGGRVTEGPDAPLESDLEGIQMVDIRDLDYNNKKEAGNSASGTVIGYVL